MIPFGRDRTGALALLALVGALAAPAPARAREVEPAWHAEPRLVRRLDRVTGSRPTTGNSARLLVNGVESFARRAHNVENADAIFLKTFILRNDATGRATVDLLKARLRDGAQVFVQFDVKGTWPDPKDWVAIARGKKQALPPLLAELAAAGAVVVPTQKPIGLRRLLHGRDHEKYLFTWKKGHPVRLITGGMNVADEYAMGGDPSRSGGHYGFGVRDTDIEIVGPEVREALQGYLDAARRFERGSGLSAMRKLMGEIDKDPAAYRPAGEATMRYVANRPDGTKNRRNIERMLETLLRATPSGETVTMSTAFFLPNDRLVARIIAAARRGVTFDLLLNASEGRSWREFHVVALAARSVYRHILRQVPKGSVRIYEWIGRPDEGLGPIHQKVFGFGKSGPVIIGSSNMDAQSFERNTEGVVLVQDPALRRAFDRMMEKDLRSAGAHEVSTEILDGDPLWEKAVSGGLRRFFSGFL